MADTIHGGDTFTQPDERHRREAYSDSDLDAVANLHMPSFRHAGSRRDAPRTADPAHYKSKAPPHIRAPLHTLRQAVRDKCVVSVSMRGACLDSTLGCLKISPGGLATAMEKMLKCTRDAEAHSSTWISWSGECAGVDEPVLHEASSETNPFAFRAIQFPLEEGIYRRVYLNVQNNMLWGASHDLADRSLIVPCSQADWAEYNTINEHFARKTADSLSHTHQNLVWIHDYQLLTTPGKLRARTRASTNDAIRNAKIGFFYHIPLPEPEAFIRNLKAKEEADASTAITGIERAADIAGSLLECNLVGFQTNKDARHFLSLVEHPVVNTRLKAMMGARTISVERPENIISIKRPDASLDRRVEVGAFPIGIDWSSESAQDAAESCSGTESASPSRSPPRRDPDTPRRLREEMTKKLAMKCEKIDAATLGVLRNTNTTIVYGIERFDFTKGIKERIRAFHTFLSDPKNHDADKPVILMLTLASTRDSLEIYKSYQTQALSSIESINSRYSPTLGYTPIVLTGEVGAKDGNLKELLLRSLDIMVINAERDGMNLTGHEAARLKDADDNPYEVLVSRSTGTGAILEEKKAPHGESLVTLIDDPKDIGELSRKLTNAIAESRSMKGSDRPRKTRASEDPITGRLEQMPVVTRTLVRQSSKKFSNAHLRRHFRKHQNVMTWASEFMSRLGSSSHRVLRRSLSD